MWCLDPNCPEEKEIQDLEKQRFEIQKKINEIRRKLPPQEVPDYSFTGLNGEPVSLKGLFGEHNELILIHNMGPECPYCTLWADGFRSHMAYYSSRSAFVLETDQNMEEWKPFVEKRGWNFPCVSSFGSSLKTDLGFKTENEGKSMNLPGASTFSREGEQILLHSRTLFGPGDQFCPPWHFFDLLKDGPGQWQPEFNL